jgi:hypothetical protein
LEEAFGGSTNRWISPKRLDRLMRRVDTLFFWTWSSALLVGLAHVTCDQSWLFSVAALVGAATQLYGCRCRHRGDFWL